jgi:riboflavin-specific deaminase-like protein
MVDLATPIERLLPDRAETTVDEQLAGFDPVSLCAATDRPYVFTNFAVTVDGHATVEGRSGPIGTETDTAMLVALRMRAEAIMIGAGTMRAERYGRLFTDPQRRAVRERRGLPADPLFVLVSGRLDLPWDAPLFTDGGGRVLIFTASEEDPPATATPLRIVRHQGRIDMVEALRYLRVERGIRSLLSEGGPHLHADLLSAGLVDELFVTLGPMLAGGEGPGLTSGLPERVTPLELAWLLRDGNELFARYRIGR